MTVSTRPRRFFVVWFFGGSIVAPCAFILTTLVSSKAIWAIRSISPPGLDFNFYYHNVWANAEVTFQLVIFGACLAFMQQKIVLRYLGIKLLRWRLMTVVGSLLGGLTISLLARNYENLSRILSALVPADFADPTLAMSLGVLAHLLPLSLLQAMVLRRRFGAAWTWVAAYLVAIPIALAVVHASNLLDLDPIGSGSLLMLCIAPVAAICTGINMIRVLLPSLRNDKIKREKSAGMLDETEVPPTESSVWDNAI